MPVPADRIRLGHVLGKRNGAGDADIRKAVAIANGEKALTRRKPVNVTVVHGAENTIGATKPRPIYAFVGNLHPELGSVGLILSRDWAKRELQGATRCDSGGLYGRFGGFVCLSSNAAKKALRALSTPNTCLTQDWENAFANEIGANHAADVDRYLKGKRAPSSLPPADKRTRCIRYARKNNAFDRRLWTWELRMHSSPTQADVFAIVLSQESYKRFLALREDGSISMTGSARILPGKAATHWLDNAKVLEALRGQEERIG